MANNRTKKPARKKPGKSANEIKEAAAAANGLAFRIPRASRVAQIYRPSHLESIFNPRSQPLREETKIPQEYQDAAVRFDEDVSRSQMSGGVIDMESCPSNGSINNNGPSDAIINAITTVKNVKKAIQPLHPQCWSMIDAIIIRRQTLAVAAKAINVSEKRRRKFFINCLRLLFDYYQNLKPRGR